MIYLRDLQDVAEGKTPASILALIQLGYVTFPPPALTEKGVAKLRRLQREEDGRSDKEVKN